MKAASQWGVSDKDRGIVCDRVISELRRLRGAFREITENHEQTRKPVNKSRQQKAFGKLKNCQYFDNS